MGRQTDKHFARIQFVVAYRKKDVRERKFRGRSLFESRIIVYYPYSSLNFFSLLVRFSRKNMRFFYPWLHYMMTHLLDSKIFKRPNLVKYDITYNHVTNTIIQRIRYYFRYYICNFSLLNLVFLHFP